MSHPDNSRPAQAGECWVELWCCGAVVMLCCCVVVALLLSAVLLRTETLCAPAGGRGLRPSTAQTGVTAAASAHLHPASRQAPEEDHIVSNKITICVVKHDILLLQQLPFPPEP